MTGPPLTGKTTIAGPLGRWFGIPVLATHEHGSVQTNGVLDTRKRLDRYPPLFAQAHPVLAAGASVILDASFLDYTRRVQLYALARRFGARLIAIRTSCDDLALIRARARQRAMDPDGKDRDVGVDALLLTLANPLENDDEFWELGVEIVEFHTGHEAFVACAPDNIKDALRFASLVHGSTLVSEFGPSDLKAVREALVEAGLCRNVVNARTNRSRRMFKWGVENQLVDPVTLQGLQAGAPLKEGRTVCPQH